MGLTDVKARPARRGHQASESLEQAMREPRAEDPDLVGKTLQEACGLWSSGCDIWAAYLSALLAARTPIDLLDANANLMAQAADMSGIATGALLRDAGQRQPTLNDA